MRDIHHCRSAVALGAAALLLTACSDDGPITGETAGLRAIHLAPDAPNVEVFSLAETVPIFEAITFGSGSSYAPLEVGTYDLAIAPAGAGLQGAVLRVDDVALAQEAFYTVVAHGTVDESDAFPLDALILEDDRSPRLLGLSRVRAVHVAPGVGDVDVSLVPEDAVAVPIATGLGYAEAGEYVEVATSASYVVEVDVGADGEVDERLALGVPIDSSAVNVFVSLDSVGEPLIVGQLDDGTTYRSAPLPTQ